MHSLTHLPIKNPQQSFMTLHTKCPHTYMYVIISFMVECIRLLVIIFSGLGYSNFASIKFSIFTLSSVLA